MVITMSSQITQNNYTFDYGLIVNVQPSLGKQVSVTPNQTATLGTMVTYVITIPNPSISRTLRNVFVTDTLDSRLERVSVDHSGGSGFGLGFLGQRIEATFSVISANTTAYLTITAYISSGVSGGVITNGATLAYSTTSGMVVTTSNVVNITLGEPIITITKQGAVTTDPQVMLYTLRLTNTGTTTAYNVAITDSLPSGLNFITASNIGAFIAASRQISWSIVSLGVGAERTLTYTVQLSQSIYTNTLFTNTAIVAHTSLTDITPGVRTYLTTTTNTLNIPMGRLGDYVWYDLDHDGIQDGGSEFPFVGVVVDLYNSNTKNYITSTTTNSLGNYYFNNLPLNVTYTVQLSTVNFVSTGILSAYTPTLLGVTVATPLTDSNGSPTKTFTNNDGVLAGYAITTSLTSAITEDLSF